MAKLTTKAGAEPKRSAPAKSAKAVAAARQSIAADQSSIGAALAPLLTTWAKKPNIENAIESAIREVADVESEATAYVRLKQLEHAVKSAIAAHQSAAFDSIATMLGGDNSGEIGGHSVSVSWPKETFYSPAVDALAAQQKLDLDALKAAERAEGKATVIQGKGRITVKLNDKG